MLNLIPIPYRILIIFVVIISAFGFGYKKGSDSAAGGLAKLAAQAAELQIKLKNEENNVKEKIVTEYVDKIQTVREKQYVYVQKAQDVVPAQHDLSSGWVYLHDHAASAESGDADNTRASDATSSGIKDNQALSTVVENYGICQQNTEQLKALQDYITKVKAAVDKANNNPKRVK